MLKAEREKVKEERREEREKKKEIERQGEVGRCLVFVLISFKVGSIEDMPTLESKLLEAQQIAVPITPSEKSTFVDLEATILENVAAEVCLSLQTST